MSCGRHTIVAARLHLGQRVDEPGAQHGHRAGLVVDLGDFRFQHGPLGVRIERRLGNKTGEGNYASQLRSRYPTSPEYQSFLKGNFE